jgi:CheY-like chemotaxis protein
MRRLCARCRQPAAGTLPAAVRNRVGDAMTFRAEGCNDCSHTGFFGRLAIAEVLVCDAEIERQINAGESTQKINEAACRNGMHSLWESALAHVARGVTSVDELFRVAESPHGTTDSAAESMADVIITGRPADSAPTFPPAAGKDFPRVLQVFEGRAFDLVDDYRAVHHDDVGDRAARDAARGSRRRSVLVAHHATETRAGVRAFLEADGFDVHEASDGASALGVIDQMAPDVVVLGVTLPHVDGYGVLEKLRSRPATSAMPVMVLASTDDDDAEVRALESGADDVLTGPLRPRALVARINVLLQKKRQEQTGIDGK